MTMRTKVLSILVAVLVVCAAGSGLAAAFGKPKPIGGSISLTLTGPAAGAREGQFSGTLSTRSFCRKGRQITLIPISDNFPNVTGYLAYAKAHADGTFSGSYTTPKKAGTSTFIAHVDKDRRRHKGKTYTCRSFNSSKVSVTTTG